jgi:hypothetical protein
MRIHRGAVVALSLALAFTAAGCAWSDWSMYAFGPAHTSFNPTESTISIDNVGALRPSWSAVLGPPDGGSETPVTANGVVYATSDVYPWQLEAFDSTAADCPAVTRCRPLWTATMRGGAVSLQVANGLVYVTTGGGGLAAFDAAGGQGCKGSPKVCTPLWSASGLSVGQSTFLKPVITHHLVYALVGNVVSAFDASGRRGCVGKPKTCVPLWSVASDGPPAVANGVLYVPNGSPPWEVRAYDASGATGCQATPRFCTPRWTDRSLGFAMSSATPPTIANGIVWIGIREGDERSVSGTLLGFDANGVKGCTGTPKICSPIRRVPTDAVIYPPAVAYNVVYTLEYRFNSSSVLAPARLAAETRIWRLRAYNQDACQTSALACAPLWTANLGDTPQGISVANGLVYVSTWSDRKLAIYDAAGRRGCTATPKICAPVWSTTLSGAPSGPSVANGIVYLGTVNDNVLHAFELP